MEYEFRMERATQVYAARSGSVIVRQVDEDGNEVIAVFSNAKRCRDVARALFALAREFDFEPEKNGEESE